MEIYLSHMVMYRLIEKLHLNTVLGDGWLSYIVTVILMITGAVIFSVLVKRILEIAGEKATQIKANRRIAKG